MTPRGVAAVAAVLGAAVFAVGRLSAGPALSAARRDARTDALTGLVNRRALYAGLDRLAAGAAAYAVLLADLDGFKSVNDTLGHDAGDAVLVEVGRRLSGLVAGGDLVARLGGDEFALLVAAPAPVASLLAADVVRAVTAPLVVAGREVTVGVSVGVAAGWPGDPAHRLLRAADTAMYRAKAAGGGIAEAGTEVDLPDDAVVRDDGPRPRARLRDLAGTGRALAGVIA